jgi:hypothetical protein
MKMRPIPPRKCIVNCTCELGKRMIVRRSKYPTRSGPIMFTTALDKLNLH